MPWRCLHWANVTFPVITTITFSTVTVFSKLLGVQFWILLCIDWDWLSGHYCEILGKCFNCHGITLNFEFEHFFLKPLEFETPSTIAKTTELRKFNIFQRDSASDDASGWLRLKMGSACRRSSWSSRRPPLTGGGRVRASSARSTSWTSTSSLVPTSYFLPTILYLMTTLPWLYTNLYLLPELKTISLKITTVDMKRPPADFRFSKNCATNSSWILQNKFSWHGPPGRMKYSLLKLHWLNSEQGFRWFTLHCVLCGGYPELPNMA